MKKMLISVGLFSLSFGVTHGTAKAWTDEEKIFLNEHFDELMRYGRAYRDRVYPTCKATNWAERDDCLANKDVYVKDPKKSKYCLNVLTHVEPIFQQCLSYFNEGFNEGARNLLQRRNASSNSARTTSPDVSSCVSFRLRAEKDSSGNPSCNIHVQNRCEAAVECQTEVTGVDSQGNRHPSRQAIHLPPGKSGVRGINQVIGCEDASMTCKAWKQ